MLADATPPPTAGTLLVYGVLHAGDALVDTEQRLAAHQRFVVDARDARAEQPVLAFFLEREGTGVGDGKLRRRVRQVLVGDSLPGSCMYDKAVSGGKLRRGDAQPSRGGRDQHRPCGGAGLAKRVPVHRHGRGAAGELWSVDFRVDGRLPDNDIVPGGVEFFGDDHRQGCLHALADLRILGVHENAVGVDAQEGVRLQRGRSCVRRFCLEHEAEHQAAAGDAGGLHETAPGELDQPMRWQRRLARNGIEDRIHCGIGRGVHAEPPMSFAARLTALRMRRYVPQRQTLPAIAESISSSLGRGLDLSRAVALMICPV